MSKLLEKKDIIHIATEIVVLIGITFYFSSKNKKLIDHIEDLSKRIEEQEDVVQKHEKIIMQLVQTINNQTNKNNSNNKINHVSSNNKTNNISSNNKTNQNSNIKVAVVKPSSTNQQRQVQTNQIVKEQNSKKINSPVKVVFKDNEIQQQKRSKIEENDDEETDESDDLDDEIAEELQELQSENYSDDGGDDGGDDYDDGLKKRM